METCLDLDQDFRRTTGSRGERLHSNGPVTGNGGCGEGAVHLLWRWQLQGWLGYIKAVEV